MRIQHKPGDAMQVDWAGDTIPIQDRSLANKAQPICLLPFCPAATTPMRNLRRHENRELAELPCSRFQLFRRRGKAARPGQLQDRNCVLTPVMKPCEPQLSGTCRVLRYRNRTGACPQAAGQKRCGSVCSSGRNLDYCGAAGYEVLLVARTQRSCC